MQSTNNRNLGSRPSNTSDMLIEKPMMIPYNMR